MFSLTASVDRRASVREVIKLSFVLETSTGRQWSGQPAYTSFYRISARPHVIMSHLKNILEVRTIVSCNPNLVSTHALVHVVSSTTGSESVFSSQHEVHENSATEQTD